jgi:hypothetical protein
MEMLPDRSGMPSWRGLRLVSIENPAVAPPARLDEPPGSSRVGLFSADALEQVCELRELETSGEDDERLQAR